MIFGADIVFPVNGRAVRNGYVECSEQGEIISVGSTADGKFPAGKIKMYKGAIVPGFVNGHCHLELSHLKGAFKQATGMDGFIKQINQMRLSVDYVGRMKAMTEEFERLYAQGVSAMADISNCDESFGIKAASKLYTRTYLEVFGTEPEDAPAIMKDVIALQNKACGYGLDAAPTPHSCYTMSPELNRMAAAEGLKTGYISYHSQESQQEDDMIKYGTGELADDYHERGTSTPPVTGRSALIYFADNLQKLIKAPVDGNVILVHNVSTDQESIDYASAAFKHLYWAICPLSNIFIHRKLPPIDLLRSNKLKICLGTDSLSSNLVLNIVDEMKCIREHFPDIELDEMLTWACLNGAEAIGKSEVFGSFDVGKSPGIVLIENMNLDTVRLTPDSKSTRLI